MQERVGAGAPQLVQTKAIETSPFLESNTVIVERGLVNIEMAPVGPEYGDVQRRGIEDLPELEFLFPDFLLRSFMLCNVLAGDQDKRAVYSRHCFGRFANAEHRAVLTNLASFPALGAPELFQAE